MTLTYVLMQNLRRNPLRASLTAIAFALPMAVFVAAISFVVAMVRIAQANEQELRLGVHHKSSLTVMLPEAHRRKIEALDPDGGRLIAVCAMRWFGGRVPATQNTLTSLAADADTFPIVYGDTRMTDAEIEQWTRDRQACVVGKRPAEKYGWKVGDRLTLESTVPPYLKLEFHVVKVMDNTERANFFYFRRDFLDESRKEAGMNDALCNIFWIKCKSADALHSLQTEIDALFANTPEETKCEDENAFGANFAQAAGDIPGLMQAMSIVVVIVVALVAGNTMMMSFRERSRELAVFRAIGFPPWRVFTIILSESVALGLLGTLLGVLPTALLMVAFPLRVLDFGPISVIEVSWLAVGASLAIGTTVGFASGLWPAIAASRLRTTDALRRIA